MTNMNIEEIDGRYRVIHGGKGSGTTSKSRSIVVDTHTGKGYLVVGYHQTELPGDSWNEIYDRWMEQVASRNDTETES